MAQFPTFFQRPDVIEDPLYVVTTIFNSPRFRSRWKLYQDFEHLVEDSGAVLYTAEVAFGQRAHALPDHSRLPPERMLLLRTSAELWLKENALNLLVAMLTRQVPDWKYVATMDADLRPVRPDWDNEAIHGLQHYDVLQPWTLSMDLDSRYEPVGKAYRSFGWAVREGKPTQPTGYYYPPAKPKQTYYHPGLAWCYRRSTWDGLGGLLETNILGSGDHFMAYALLGKAEALIPPGTSAGYKAAIMEWQERALAVVKRNVGATDGLMLHHWHGAKSTRGYHTRYQILSETAFDPNTDLRKDAQGLFHLGHRGDARSLAIRDRVRTYFHARREDDPSP